MTITFTDGTTTSNATGINLFDISADRHYATWIFTHNMAAADILEVKVFVRDQNSNVMRSYTTEKIEGVQNDPSFFIPYLPTKQYRVTIRRVAGSDKAYTWQRIEVT